MSEIKIEDYTRIKGEVINALERAKLEVQELDTLFGPGTKVIEVSTKGSNDWNRLELLEGQDYRIRVDKMIK